MKIQIVISLCNPFDTHYEYPSKDNANLFLYKDGALVGGWCSAPGNDSARWAGEAIKSLHDDADIEVQFKHQEAEEWWASVKRLDLSTLTSGQTSIN